MNARLLCSLALTLLAGCAAAQPGGAGPTARKTEAVQLRFHVGSTQEHEGYDLVADERGEPLYLAPQPFLTDEDIWQANVYSSEKKHLVLLEFTPAGAQALEWVTRRRVGGRLAVFLDDQLIMSPFIRAPLAGGKVYLDGEFTKRRATEIAEALIAQRAARAPVFGRPEP